VPGIEAYREIIGNDELDELYLLAERLKGKKVQNINSTAVGGGVAEILSRMIPLLRDLGVDAYWDVIKGDEKFFTSYQGHAQCSAWPEYRHPKA